MNPERSLSAVVACRLTPRHTLTLTLLIACIGLLAWGATEARAAASLSLNMTSFDYGAKHVGGEATYPGEFEVTNDGDQPVRIGWVDTTPENPRMFFVHGAFDFCTYETLQPGEGCIVSTYFEPPIAGEFTGKFIVPSEDLAEPVTADLEGVGFPELMPDVAITPARLDFGRVGIGTTSEARTIEVKNTGEGDMRLGVSKITGPDVPAFRIVQDNCDEITMAAGSVCTVKVAFKPSAAGIRNATLTVPTSVANADTGVPLAGTGVGIAPDPDPDPDPDPVESGTASLKVAKVLPRVKGRHLVVPVTCRTVRMKRCAGGLTLRAAKRGGPGRALGRAPFDIAPGKRTVLVKLKPAALRSLEKRGRIKAKVESRVRQGDGETVARTAPRPIRG